MAELQANLPAHEQIFDEICGKLQELSLKKQETLQETPAAPVVQTPAAPPIVAAPKSENFNERLEKMQSHFRKSQDDLKATQQEIHDKIKSLDSMSFPNTDMSKDVKRMSEQLDQERISNSKLSTDLAKSLELNLRLQFEIEEIRAKAGQQLNEEKKHNVFLQEKVKGLSHELDLSQAYANETRSELAKAKEKFQYELQGWINEKRNLQNEIQNQISNVEEKRLAIQSLREEVSRKEEEVQKSSEALREYDLHFQQQHEMMKTLSEVAEKKMIELKMSLDKKAFESQDYYSHLQQAMTQIHVLRQENSALKDYISKLSALHQQKAGQQLQQQQQQQSSSSQPQSASQPHQPQGEVRA